LINNQFIFNRVFDETSMPKKTDVKAKVKGADAEQKVLKKI